MAADSIPELTLTPDDPFATSTPAAQTAPVIASQQPALAESSLDESKLTDAERKAVDDFSRQIDLTDQNMILNYGAAAQRKVSSFSDSALASVKTKDLGEVGQTLSNLVVQLRGFSVEEQPKGLFARGRKKLATWRASYAKAEANVDQVVEVLEGHQRTLMKDVAMLDQLYDANLQYYRELTMYILAGKKKLNEVRSTQLAELKKRAETSGLPEDAQAYNDLATHCDRFEKKIHDLDLTRMICIQMAPQVRLIQNNDALMIEKIQSSLVNTIPLWKSQMVLAIGLENSRAATEAQHQVNDVTNELLKRNADILRLGTVATAKEAERSIVDIETLRHTNEQLVATLDEVVQIQNQGREGRAAAEIELRKIEGELKTKLIALKN